MKAKRCRHTALKPRSEVWGAKRKALEVEQEAWGKSKCRENSVYGLWFIPKLVSSLLYCAVVSHSVMSNSCHPMDCSPPGSSVHGDSPGKKTGVGCHALLQGIFPTQGLNSGHLHCRRILYHLSHQGSPRIMEWVAYPFSRGSFQPRDWTHIPCVSCTGRRIRYRWATREALSRTGSGTSVCIC